MCDTLRVLFLVIFVGNSGHECAGKIILCVFGQFSVSCQNDRSGGTDQHRAHPLWSKTVSTTKLSVDISEF